MVTDARDAFRESPAPGTGDLNRRLLSASGNGRSDYWRVARTMVRDEPLLGTGAGSFEAHWFRERSVPFHARDAHNLYLETLAELGPVGLALLLATLALPLLALPGARRFAHAPAAVGGLRRLSRACGCRLGLGAPGRDRARDLLRRGSPRRRAAGRSAVADGQAPRYALALLAPLAAVALVGARRQPRRLGQHRRDRGRRPGARRSPRRSARSAWAPWSEEAWQLRGEAELELGDARPPAGASPMRSSAIPKAGARGSTSPRRAADASGSRPSIERQPSTRSALRSKNSEQILNDWQRRGSPRRASTRADQ